MSKRNTLPRWAQWAAGITTLALAVGAAGLSLRINVEYGLQASLAVAVAYGLSDVAKLSIPVVAQGIGWTRHMQIVAARRQAMMERPALAVGRSFPNDVTND